MSLPKIGNMAPKFVLENQKGEKVALKDFKGEKEHDGEKKGLETITEE